MHPIRQRRRFPSAFVVLLTSSAEELLCRVRRVWRRIVAALEQIFPWLPRTWPLLPGSAAKRRERKCSTASARVMLGP